MVSIEVIILQAILQPRHPVPRTVDFDVEATARVGKPRAAKARITVRANENAIVLDADTLAKQVPDQRTREAMHVAIKDQVAVEWRNLAESGDL